MNEFTKEELQYFLMTMKPFHFLWKHDPLELERKIQSMIDNYVERECSDIRDINCIEPCPTCGEHHDN